MRPIGLTSALPPLATIWQQALFGQSGQIFAIEVRITQESLDELDGAADSTRLQVKVGVNKPVELVGPEILWRTHAGGIVNKRSGVT